LQRTAESDTHTDTAQLLPERNAESDTEYNANDEPRTDTVAEPDEAGVKSSIEEREGPS